VNQWPDAFFQSNTEVAYYQADRVDYTSLKTENTCRCDSAATDKLYDNENTAPFFVLANNGYVCLASPCTAFHGLIRSKKHKEAGALNERTHLNNLNILD